MWSLRIQVQRVTCGLLCTPLILGPGLHGEAFQETMSHKWELEETHSVFLSDDLGPSWVREKSGVSVADPMGIITGLARLLFSKPPSSPVTSWHSRRDRGLSPG